MKYISIDTETTGLDPDKCQVIEFGAVIDDLSDPKPIKDLPKFQCYIRYPEYKGSAFALQMNQKILHTLAIDSEEDPICDAEDVAEYFEGFLFENGYVESDKIIPAGKNFASFDWPFIKDFPLYINKMKIRFDHRMLDPMSMYITKDDIYPPDTSECLKRAGLNTHVAHNAIDDACDVIRLIRYKILCPTFQPVLSFETVKGSCSNCHREIEYTLDTPEDSVIRILCDECISTRILE